MNKKQLMLVLAGLSVISNVQSSFYAKAMNLGPVKTLVAGVSTLAVGGLTGAGYVAIQNDNAAKLAEIAKKAQELKLAEAAKLAEEVKNARILPVTAIFWATLGYLNKDAVKNGYNNVKGFMVNNYNDLLQVIKNSQRSTVIKHSAVAATLAGAVYCSKMIYRAEDRKLAELSKLEAEKQAKLEAEKQARITVVLPCKKSTPKKSSSVVKHGKRSNHRRK